MIDEDELRKVRTIYSKRLSAARKEKEEAAFLLSFPTAEIFTSWWAFQFEQQGGRCSYCKTSIVLIKSLIEAGLLQTRKVRAGGRRGERLELERKDPIGRYEPGNCVLICMPCNNDKSNVYGHDEYERFFGPNRKAHYDWLAQKLPRCPIVD